MGLENCGNRRNNMTKKEREEMERELDKINKELSLHTAAINKIIAEARAKLEKAKKEMLHG